MSHVVTNDIVAAFAASLPRPKATSLQQLEKQASKYAEMILDFKDQLHEMLLKRGGNISGAWDSWDESRRAEVLRKAMPTIPQRKRPDLEPIKCDPKLSAVNEQALRFAQLLPYINIAQLAKADHAMLLLHGRAGCEPFYYAFADLENARRDHQYTLPLPEARSHAVQVIDSETPDRYGAIGITGSEDSADIPLTGGMIMLEAQAKGYFFAVRLAEAIMKECGYPSDRQALAKLDKYAMLEPEPNDRSFAAVSARAPYRTANAFEPRELLAIVTEYAENARDHFVELLANPEYLVDALQEHKSQQGLATRIERNRLIKSGSLHQEHTESSLDHFRLLRNAHFAVFHWDIVNKLLDDLLPLFERPDEKNVKRDMTARIKFLDLFADFDNALQAIIEFYIEELGQSVSCLPQMLLAYENAPSQTTKKSKRSIHKAELKDGIDPTLSYLHQLFRAICNPELRSQIGLFELVDALGDAIEADKIGKQYISSTIMQIFSDLILAVSLLHQLETFQPHCAIWRQYHMVTKESRVNQEAIIMTKDLLGRSIMEYSLQNALDCDDGRLAYPIPDSQANLLQRQRAREATTGFWDGLTSKLKATSKAAEWTIEQMRAAKALKPKSDYGIGSYELFSAFESISNIRGFYTQQTTKLDTVKPSPKLNAVVPKDGQLAEKAFTSLVEGRAANESLRTAGRGGNTIDSSLGALVAPSSTQIVPSQRAYKQPVSQPQAIDELSNKFDGLETGYSLTLDHPRRFRTTEEPPKPKRRDEHIEQPGEIQPAINPEPDTVTQCITLNARAYSAMDYVLNMTSEQTAGELEWGEFTYAMTYAGFSYEVANGSVRKFARGPVKTNAHEPHPGTAWPRVPARQFGRRFKRKLDAARIEFVPE